MITLYCYSHKIQSVSVLKSHSILLYERVILHMYWIKQSVHTKFYYNFSELAVK